MSVPACLLSRWSAKMLRLVGFVSPLRTELEGDLKFCRTGRTMECRMRCARTNGSVCNRGKLIALSDLVASRSRSGPANALKHGPLGAYIQLDACLAMPE